MTVFLVGEQEDRVPDMDLGEGVTAVLYDVNGFSGLILQHKAFGVKKCTVAVNFDTPQARKIAPTTRKWRVESLEPLTVAGIIACDKCNLRGRIYEGVWEAA